MPRPEQARNRAREQVHDHPVPRKGRNGHRPRTSHVARALRAPGGLQEEVTALSFGKACLVLRTPTGRPEAGDAARRKVDVLGRSLER